VTLEKPPITLGENQVESSSLFLKIAFLQWEIFSKKSASKFTTYLFSVPHNKLEITANRAAINVVQPPRFSCSLSTLNVVVRPALNALYKPRFACRKNSNLLFDFCANQLYRFLENRAKICLSLCAESAVLICSTAALECVPSCYLLLLPIQKCLLLFCSLFQSAHERMNDIFLLFLL